MKKKLLATGVALAMTAAMGTMAMAEEDRTATLVNGTSEKLSQDITVSATYDGTKTSDTVINVAVKWDAMEWVFTKDARTKWDAEKHVYDFAGNSSNADNWSLKTGSGNSIVLTNHSNSDITATFSFAEKDQLDGDLSTQFYTKDAQENKTTVTSVDMSSAFDVAYNDVSEADSETVYFDITDGYIYSNETSLGTITVSVEAKTTNSDQGNE